MPSIFSKHFLNQLWAYKYDSMRDGITVHADIAAINVNLWLTPDDANLEPDGGGLVVHSAAAPFDWDFESFNSDFKTKEKSWFSED